jgi:hypothetical protein
MRFTLDIWTQDTRDSDGRFVRHEIDEIDPEASLVMLDQLNERLIHQGAHGPSPLTATAGKASAARARCSSTGSLTAPTRSRPARRTCATSPTAPRSAWIRFASTRSPSCATWSPTAPLNFLPRGQPERGERTRSTVLAMDEEGFGGADVGRVDLGQRRIALVGQRAAVGDPVLGRQRVQRARGERGGRRYLDRSTWAGV